MNVQFKCKISEDILEKFNLAVDLNKDNCDEVVEKMMIKYIADSFSIASQKYKAKENFDAKSKGIGLTAYTGKAINRIPKWALSQNQYNHKIVRAFFQIENEFGNVTLDILKNRCSDKINHPSTYVPNFGSNFAQMKIDTPQSHGKVFETKDDKVIIWDYVKNTLLEYKDSFIK